MGFRNEGRSSKDPSSPLHLVVPKNHVFSNTGSCHQPEGRPCPSAISRKEDNRVFPVSLRVSTSVAAVAGLPWRLE